jgi:hypothetical protein
MHAVTLRLEDVLDNGPTLIEMHGKSDEQYHENLRAEQIQLYNDSHN